MKKNILVYGDSNVWGWIGVEEAFPSRRYRNDERWPGIMAAELGDEYHVSVDGLAVRSTNMDDAVDWNNIEAEMFNGAKLLPAAIAREMPLDLLIIALGTNDLKAETARSAADIAEAIVALARVANESAGGVAYHYQAPQVILVSPVPVNDMPHPDFAAMFEGAKQKSELLGEALKAAADKAGIAMFDAGMVVGSAKGVDGLHIDVDQHKKLGMEIARFVRTL